MTNGIFGRSVGVRVLVAGVRLTGVWVASMIVGRRVEVSVGSRVRVGVQVDGNPVLVKAKVGRLASVDVGRLA